MWERQEVGSGGVRWGGVGGGGGEGGAGEEMGGWKPVGDGGGGQFWRVRNVASALATVACQWCVGATV